MVGQAGISPWMPEPIGAKGESRDRRPYSGERPDLAWMRDEQSADVRRPLNAGTGDIEGPGQDEGDRKAARHQGDKDLLDPRWRSKNRQDRAANLDQSQTRRRRRPTRPGKLAGLLVRERSCPSAVILPKTLQKSTDFTDGHRFSGNFRICFVWETGQSGDALFRSLSRRPAKGPLGAKELESAIHLERSELARVENNFSAHNGHETAGPQESRAREFS